MLIKRVVVASLLATFVLSSIFAGGSPEPTQEEVPELVWYVVSTPPRDTELVMEEINSFLPDRIGATLDVRFLDWGEYEQRIQLIIASGEDWDMAFTSNWMNSIYENVARGAFLQLDDLLPEHAPNLFNHFDEEVWNGLRIDGGIYAIVNGWLASGPAFAVRTDLAEKYGLDFAMFDRYEGIEKLYALEPFLQDIADNEPGMIPFGIPSGGHMGTYYLAMGIEPIVGDRVPGAIRFGGANPYRVVNQFELPEVRRFLQTRRDWFQNGFFPPDAAIIDEVVTLQTQGQVAVGDIDYAPYAEIESREFWGGRDIRGVPMGNGYLRGDLFTSATGINQNTEYAEEALALLDEILTSKDLYNLLAIGIEGTHYEVLQEDPDTGVIEARFLEDSGFAHGIWWEFMDGNAAYFVPEGAPLTLNKEKLDWNNNAPTSPLFGFTFNPEPVRTELANIRAVSDEFYPSLVTGALDPNDLLPRFLDALETAGVDRLIAEIQRQVDAWRANQ